MRAPIGLTLGLAFLCSSAFAEQAPPPEREPQTKLEAFQAQTGAVVIKGYSSIGKVSALGSVEVSSMEFTDGASGKKQSGVLIEITESGRLENSDRAFIDYDEVDSLLKGIDYISQATSSVTKLSQFEATYKTKGRFSATTFSGARGIEAAVKCGLFRPATAYVSLEQLGRLRALIAQAKEKLDAVR